MEKQVPLTTATVSAAAPPVAGTAKTQKKFIGYIHNFRGVAIIYVVGAHILLNWPAGSVAHRVLDLIFQNSTILFLFIAGYLFQHLSAKFEYGDYLKKKFQNVICPYLLLSLPVIVYRVVTQDINGFTLEDHPDFGSWPAWEQAGYYLLHGAHLQQLWFIPMIALYYLIAPVLLYIDRKPVLYYVLIPLIVLSLVVQRSTLSDTLTMAVHFLSVYVFGMFMSRYKEQYLAFARKYAALVTLLPLAVLALNYFADQRFYDPLDYTHKMLFCCFYIYWLWRLEKYMPRFIDVLAVLSFGIYFVHYFFVLFLRGAYQKVFHEQIPGNMLYWTVCLVIVMLLSVWTLQLARRVLGGKSKYLVGC
ncbi:acyltransferase family protein [Chitinophaga japonensis]|uniref:Surface polysaccharide O-acyltransferase-like enzyme n=1 Tax=Chitinophaga japonensis TaxID=104662 RepID=A0A562SLY6_CHIJA|nr:acyltransferase [Chitinophaga japonensis]TWI82371.1 surface polysaccharide O-acyltransferase-like enzyme [Chitinophaga japonensis]